MTNILFGDTGYFMVAHSILCTEFKGIFTFVDVNEAFLLETFLRSMRSSLLPTKYVLLF